MTNNFDVKMDEYLPLRDVVFKTLRQAILKGELEPGERLMEIQLAERLGVSRTPIREAIRKLELEGLVLMIPRKGAVVARISENNLRDVLEVRRTLEEQDYQPRTCLMDEIQAGETYELVISVLHGGAFMRYRIGDMYHCVSAGGGQLPRLTFVDRVPNVIDIAGFTRITVSSMQEVIRLSRLELGDWVL